MKRFLLKFEHMEIFQSEKNAMPLLSIEEMLFSLLNFKSSLMEDKWYRLGFNIFPVVSTLKEVSMFSLSELVPLNQHQSRSKLLKPWWEVFMDYLVVLMLMASVLACTEQLSRDRVVCIPWNPLLTANTSQQHPTAGVDVSLNPSQRPPEHFPHDMSSEVLQSRGRKTHLVYQQYIYISQVLYLLTSLPKIIVYFPCFDLTENSVIEHLTFVSRFATMKLSLSAPVSSPTWPCCRPLSL